MIIVIPDIHLSDGGGSTMCGLPSSDIAHEDANRREVTCPVCLKIMDENIVDLLCRLVDDEQEDELILPI